MGKGRGGVCVPQCRRASSVSVRKRRGNGRDIRSENAETEKKFFDDALTEIKVSSDAETVE